MYRRSMQVAVSELRRAARTSNALEKLEALELAEQKLRDAQWLRGAEEDERFEAGLAEIARSRRETLKQAVTAVQRLLDAAESGVAQQSEVLEAAGRLLALLNHHLPDDARVEELSARFRGLGGQQPPYRPPKPLWELYHRQAAGIGCGGLVGGLVAVAVIWWIALC